MLHQYATMKVADLAACKADYNPRTITPEKFEALRASLRRFGVVEPIVWNRRGNRVVGGHQRIDALAAEGVDVAPVVVVDLTDEEEKALNVALNNPSGDWDREKLALLTGALGDDLRALTGFTARELAVLADAGFQAGVKAGSPVELVGAAPAETSTAAAPEASESDEAAPPATASDSATTRVTSTNAAVGGDAVPVTLVFKAAEHRRFVAAVNEVRRLYATATISEAVLRAVENAASAANAKVPQ
jgi:hypothetical protein